MHHLKLIHFEDFISNKNDYLMKKYMLKRILNLISVSWALIVISQQRIIKAYHAFRSKEINRIPLTPEH